MNNLAKSLTLFSCFIHQIVFAQLSTASKKNIETYTLENGLKVVLKPDYRAPLVMTQIWYEVGAADESKSHSGISHFVEHTMFHDNALLSAEEFNQVHTYLGGVKNAFTSSLFTVYFQTLPANQYPIALEVESQRMTGLFFNSEKIEAERKVIKEERRQTVEDNPISNAYEAFLPVAMPDNPQALPVLGTMKNIEALSVAQLKAWHETWYAPNNASLVLVGDFEIDSAKQWIDKYFAPIPAKTLPERQNLSQAMHQGYREITSYQKIQVPFLVMAFNVPSIKTGIEESYALSLLADLLDGAVSARFEKHLVREKQLFEHIRISYDPLNKGDTLFVIQAVPKKGVEFAQAEAAILSEINQFVLTDIQPSEIRKSRNRLISELAFSNDGLGSKARLLGILSVLDLPLDMLEKLPEKITEIKPELIKEVAKKYLVKENLAVLKILPKKR